MTLANKYPIVFQFFAGHFPDADFEGLTDKEVIANYCVENEKAYLEDTKQELDKLINDRSVWDDVGVESNRYFQSNEEVLDWLIMIQEQLVKNI